jgi:hypothetical protein
MARARAMKTSEHRALLASVILGSVVGLGFGPSDSENAEMAPLRMSRAACATSLIPNPITDGP